MVHPLQAATDGVLQWADSVGGCFNPSKSCTMQFSPRSRAERAHPTHPTPHLRMQGDDVSDVTTHRHLGVILDSNLDFINHVATITTKFRQRAVLLIHMTKRITPAVASRLYTGYVRPVVEYASSLWQFQLSSAQATNLERLQARVARVILRQYGVYPPQTEPKASLFAHLQWPSLAWRRHIQCLLELHHLINSQMTTLEDLGYSVSNSARRPQHLLPPARASTHTRTTFLFVTTATWNSLPAAIRTVSSPKCFTALVRTHFSITRYEPSGFIPRRVAMS